MLGLAFIVANSLITNNLEEKTYENAMLRTLGWDKSNIVLVTLIKMKIMINNLFIESEVFYHVSEIFV